MIRVVTGAAVAAMLAAPAAADRVYADNEADALRCAHVMLFTSVALENEGFMPTDLTALMAIYAVGILNNYVSGTHEQKMLALDAIAGRRGLLGSPDEFTRVADGCTRRFPL